MHGSAQSPNGVGKILPGQQQVLAKLAQGNVSRRSSAEPRLLLRVPIGHSDDGRSLKRQGSFAEPRIVPDGKSNFCEVRKNLIFSA